jgi:hypothetical protein
LLSDINKYPSQPLALKHPIKTIWNSWPKFQVQAIYFAGFQQMPTAKEDINLILNVFLLFVDYVPPEKTGCGCLRLSAGRDIC